MTNLLKINFYFAAAYLLFFIFPEKYFDYATIRYARSIIELIVFLVLSGLNLAALMQIATKKAFTALESISIASAASLLVMPFALLLEHEILGKTAAWLPFFNFLITFSLAVYFHFFSESKVIFQPLTFENQKLKISAVIGNFLKTPYFLPYVLYASFVFVVFGAYYVLPELDPYYWLDQISKYFATNNLAEISGYRPLFSALAYVFIQSAHIDAYAFFKYVLPILSGLALIPATLLASQFKSGLQKAIIILILFASASALLYSQLPIPQAILAITMAYFFLFLAYAWVKKEEIFFYLGGIVAFFSIFYHEAAAIVFLAWLLVFFAFNWKKIKDMVVSNKLPSAILLALILTNFHSSLQNIFSFLAVWMKKIWAAAASLDFNFYFPAQYTNVDGNQMGWSGLEGVIKYYGYYVGPAIILILITFAYSIYSQKSFRNFVKNEATKNKSIITIILLFLVFFSIAEIFPRLFSLAMLPERAWIFGGMFTFIFLLLIFRYFENRLKIIYSLIIFSLLTNLAGALYINDLKKFVTTKEHLQSAEWIQTNLPPNRVIFSDKKINLLKFHSQSKAVRVSPQFYENQEAFEAELVVFENRPLDIKSEYTNYLNTLEQNLNQLKKKNDSAISEIVPIANSIALETKKISEQLSSYSQPTPYAYYIYYAKENENNPYLSRPYYQKSTLNNFIFDQQPEKFRRVYSSKNNDIIIWKILQ